MTFISTTDITNADTILFLEGLKNQLNKFTNLDLVSAVTMVFSKVRSRLSYSDTEQLSANLPELFHSIFVSHEMKADSDTTCLHLDEIVKELVEEDLHQERRVFKSEIDTLEIVIVILNRLAKLFQKLGINPYPYTLTHELKEAMQGQSI